MRARKILIPVLVVLLLVLVLLPLSLRFIFPEPKLRAMVLPRAEEALGRSVECGRIGLKPGFGGLSVELETLELGADSTGYGLKSLDLPLLRARLAWLPLLRREVDIKTLTFVEPGIELLLPPAGAAAESEQAAEEAAGTAAVTVAAPDLRLENARIHLQQEAGFDLELRIGSGRFASVLTPAGDLSLGGRLEDATLKGTLADGRAVSAGAELELGLAMLGGQLSLNPVKLILSETAVDSGAGAPALSASRLEITAEGSGALAALLASPPDLTALTLAGEMKLSDLHVARTNGASYALTLSQAEGPFRLDAETAGELRLEGTRLQGSRLETATSLGNRFVSELADGRLDLALKPDGQGLVLPHFDLDFASYALRSEPAAGKAIAMRGAGATLRSRASLPRAPGKPSMTLELRAEPMQLEGEAFPQAMQVKDIAVQGDLDSLRFSGLSLQAGASRLSASGGLALPREPGTLPRMDIRVSGPLLDLADFLPPAPTGTGKTGANRAAPPEASLAPLPGRAEFAIERLVSERATVTALSGRLLAELDGLRVEDLRGTLMGGGVTGALDLAPRPDGSFDCRGDFAVQRVQAPEFLAAFTPVQRGIEGSLSTETGFDFVLVPGGKPRGLALDAAFDLADGALVDLPALQQLSRLAGFDARDQYQLGSLAHRFQVRDDRVLARDLRLPFEDGFLVATGSAGLDGSLDFRGKWELGARTVERIGTKGVLGFLANAEGRVELDFIVRGTTKSPVVTLDTQSLQERLADEARELLKDEGEDILQKGLDALRKKLR